MPDHLVLIPHPRPERDHRTRQRTVRDANRLVSQAVVDDLAPRQHPKRVSPGHSAEADSHHPVVVRERRRRSWFRFENGLVDRFWFIPRTAGVQGDTRDDERPAFRPKRPFRMSQPRTPLGIVAGAQFEDEKNSSTHRHPRRHEGEAGNLGDSFSRFFPRHVSLARPGFGLGLVRRHDEDSGCWRDARNPESRPHPEHQDDRPQDRQRNRPAHPANQILEKVGHLFRQGCPSLRREPALD